MREREKKLRERKRPLSTNLEMQNEFASKTKIMNYLFCLVKTDFGEEEKKKKSHNIKTNRLTIYTK